MRHDADVLQGRCGCGGTLLCRYDLSRVPKLADIRALERGLARYGSLLPLRAPAPSLGESETPLLALPKLSERWGIEVLVKDDGPMPGGTFKARGAAIGLGRAVELGISDVVMPSAGNAGGAWSLYAARLGVALTVTMSITAPLANQAEVAIAGARLVLVDGSIADAGKRAVAIAAETGAFLAATFYEPYRLEGKKSAWLELFDQMGDESSMRMPSEIVLPVGGGVAAIAAAKAAEEVTAARWAVGESPRLVGVQTTDCDPITRAFEAGAEDVSPWDGHPSSIAAGLRVPAPVEGRLVLKTVRASGGVMASVTEDEIRCGMRTLAEEGVLAGPEGAATVAAAERLVADGALVGPVVLYNTGSGYKYPEVLLEAAGQASSPT